MAIATQCSFNNLEKINDLLYHWQGPVSIAVFAPTSFMHTALQAILQMQKCNKFMRQFASFHLTTHSSFLYDETVALFIPDCATFAMETTSNYNWSVPYPVNLLRNIAISQIKQTFYLLIDADMIPSNSLLKSFHNLLDNYQWANFNKTALIMPSFEILSFKNVPYDKTELFDLFIKGQARQFYGGLCQKCQHCVDYTKWFQLPVTPDLNLAYEIEWKDPCEPFYITNFSPEYNENFQQYGFNRISQVCELHVADFRFIVLDNAFLLHDGFKTQNNFHTTKEIEQNKNRVRYRDFKKKISLKYPTSSKKC